MPNWCENTLTVTGEPAELARFREHAKGPNGDLDANKFIPYPEEFALLDKISPFRETSVHLTDEEITKAVMMGLKGRDLTRDGYNQGGYDWCIQNWGTKGNLYETIIKEVSSRILEYRFLTAWSPPAPVIVKMSEMFPSLLFELEYKEEGNEFEGTLTAQNGQLNDERR